MIWLLAAWLLPAVIAGALGWKGIWGNSSAFFDFLLPLPLSGGILHVPGMAIVAAILISAERTRKTPRLLSLIAVTTLLSALALQIDFERFNHWLFTDFEPSGSPLRLDGNPLLLFVSCDALIVWLWSLGRSRAVSRRAWGLVPLVPLAIVGFQTLSYTTQGPVFEPGASAYGEIRGNQTLLVYTDQSYDEGLFADWLLNSTVAPPWASANVEHLAIVFTSSRQRLERHDFSALEGSDTIATFCWFEEDRLLAAHAGYFDCAAQRPTLVERLIALRAQQPAGLDDELSDWRAAALLCRGALPVAAREDAVALVDHCRTRKRQFNQDLLQAKRRYGRDSREVRMMQKLGEELGFE